MLLTPHTILQMINDFKEPIGAAFGGVIGWWGNIARNKIAKKRNEIDASKIGNETLRLALLREKELSRRIIDLTNQSRKIWSQFYALGQISSEYHLAALSARQNLNELETKCGRQITIFDKLPILPFENSEFPGFSEKKAGDQAAGTADPRSPKTHVENTPLH